MRKQGPIVKILLWMLLAAMVLTGCGKKDKDAEQNGKGGISVSGEVDPDTEILKVGLTGVSLRELYVYVLHLKEQYEPVLGDRVWYLNTGDGDKTVEQLAKDQLLETVTEVKIINKNAEKNDIKLDEEDENTLKTAVSTYYASLDQEAKDKYGITEEVLYRVYRENMLAETAFEIMTNDLDTDDLVKDVREIHTAFFYVSGTDAAAEKEAKSLRKQALKEEDFTAFARSNSQSMVTEHTFGRDDTTLEPAFVEASFALSTGDVSPVIKGEEGYYVIYCVSDNDEDATTKRKTSLILEAQKESFYQTYAEWAKDIKVTVNSSAWDSIFIRTN
ncbi:peptidylprolyl isomerase [Anaerolentibacter hominis]|uniref:peptidylprolyl isomerase n=1 Tax=Anaerolentibacter hominis TaxID=3079009 RepID=UPI0031B8380E